MAIAPWLYAAEVNLLHNAGFEALDGGMPAYWNLFVQPEPGAEGRLDTQTFTEGARAAYLHNPDTYAKDPCNNWSQNLSNAVAGKTIVAGGSIKTSGAASGAIWVQCWRRDPWGMLRLASTADALPVSGDTDWIPVAVKFAVPSDTDFVVVRCIVRGAGSAWFDDLRLFEAGTETAPLAERSASAPPPNPPVKEATVAAASLARETAAMAKTIESLRDANEALRRDLAQMREEIADLRERLAPREQPAPPPKKAVPPLVPHGYAEEEPRP
ncbi:MAG: hypothetical protein NTU83_11255 [Candidatus Hydrogenedentes bacterium]|nr:hypothetical protein [Candidatus Hydrogenedentota bacterium]